MVQVYGRLVGQFLGHSYTNLLAVLWAQYPELEPEEMRQEYEEPIASLTPESQQAIRAFLEAAKPALALAQQFAAAAKPLPYGGLPEIEGSVTEIEGFLLTPRFRDAE